MASYGNNSLGFAQVTGLGTAKGLTLPSWPQHNNQEALKKKVQKAVVQAEGANVRWRDDGTDPTATVGMLLEAGWELSYEGDASKLRFIEVAASATLNVAFYGY